MKKALIIAATTAVLASGLVATEAVAGDYTKKCKSCHSVSKNKMGPAWKTIQAAYGSADKLVAAFAGGFKVEDRAVANSNPKYKKAVKTMSKQFKKIKKDVKKGKISYEELAAIIFAK